MTPDAGRHAPLPAADGAVAARHDRDRRQHLGAGARVVRHLAAGRAHAACRRRRRRCIWTSRTRAARGSTRAQWPLPAATPTSYYFGAGRSGSDAVSPNDGVLSPQAPTAVAGADTVAWTGTTSPCDIQTDQWGAGALALGFQSLDTNDPCDLNDVTLGTGPGALTYTTAPVDSPEVRGGTDRRDVVHDIDRVPTPSWRPRSRPSRPRVTACRCRRAHSTATMRAVDQSRSWTTASGQMLLPVHPLTQASQRRSSPGR